MANPWLCQPKWDSQLEKSQGQNLVSEYFILHVIGKAKVWILISCGRDSAERSSGVLVQGGFG